MRLRVGGIHFQENKRKTEALDLVSHHSLQAPEVPKAIQRFGEVAPFGPSCFATEGATRPHPHPADTRPFPPATPPQRPMGAQKNPESGQKTVIPPATAMPCGGHKYISRSPQLRRYNALSSRVFSARAGD